MNVDNIRKIMNAATWNMDIDAFVEWINEEEFCSELEKEDFVAAYLLECCEDAGYGFSESNIMGHMDILLEEGAKFDPSIALVRALDYLEDYQLEDA
jgi:hypothetical protein